jgi:hypothetical protein
VLLVSAVLSGSAVMAIALSSVGPSPAAGPVTTALERVGVLVGSAEAALRRRVSGPGREAALAWFDAFRTDPGRLRSPDRVLLGAFDSRIGHTLEGVLELERSIKTTLPVLHVYSAWGDRPDQQFPIRQLSAIWNMGSVPMVTWEPWLTDFENALHPHLPLRDARDRHGLAAVARGDYDFYVDAWAGAAKQFGRPLFVRLGHEMNDPYRYPWGPQNNTKEEFIGAWRHIVERFRRAGANNVLWIWAPHVAYQYWELYYPGAEYVDWVSTGALNFGTVAHWSRWWTFDELFGRRYPDLAAFGKPIMVDELGSLSVGGDRRLWYDEALTNLPARYPAVRAVLFFHARDDQTLTYQRVNWAVVSDQDVAETIARAVAGWEISGPAPMTR